jgi:hypothetical protein
VPSLLALPPPSTRVKMESGIAINRNTVDGLTVVPVLQTKGTKASFLLPTFQAVDLARSFDLGIRRHSVFVAQSIGRRLIYGSPRDD